MIDTQTGILNFSEHFSIYPLEDLNSLNTKITGLKKEFNDMKNGWKWLHLKDVEFEKERGSIAIAFEKNRVKSLNLILSSVDLKDITELAKRKEYENLITKICGNRRIFPWGQIEAHHNIKAGFSSINICYASKN